MLGDDLDRASGGRSGVGDGRPRNARYPNDRLINEMTDPPSRRKR
jgi:hypothetical protein